MRARGIPTPGIPTQPDVGSEFCKPAPLPPPPRSVATACGLPDDRVPQFRPDSGLSVSAANLSFIPEPDSGATSSFLGKDLTPSLRRTRHGPSPSSPSPPCPSQHLPPWASGFCTSPSCPLPPCSCLLPPGPGPPALLPSCSSLPTTPPSPSPIPLPSLPCRFDLLSSSPTPSLPNSSLSSTFVCLCISQTG